MTKSLMFVGTSSNVGKSVLATAFCRILLQDGYHVAPFKAQNMSLNSAVTPSGREIGRAQAVQAEASGILPSEHMNPVLLKPTGHMASQVIVQGRPIAVKSAREYFLDTKSLLWEAVVDSYHYLADRYDLIVIEGAGSPVEMNLKERDIANMKCAEMANADVILVADIDRGGVFASVVGTLQLLSDHERARVKGILINKFRGDVELFGDGRAWLESYTGVPVLGVIPYIQHIGIDEEDSMGLESDRYRSTPLDTDTGAIRAAIVQLPHISNFTDFDPLFLEPDIAPYFCTSVDELEGADIILLPGTKSTVFDLDWLNRFGWKDAIHSAVHKGVHMLGICGGYQILGDRVRDPAHVESDVGHALGLGLLAIETWMEDTKTTRLVEGRLRGPFDGIHVRGYQIHMGKTVAREGHIAFANLMPVVKDQKVDADHRQPFGIHLDGGISPDGRVVGTYLHGILHNDEFRAAWLNRIRREKGMPEQTAQRMTDESRELAYNTLAEVVRANVDMSLIDHILSSMRS